MRLDPIRRGGVRQQASAHLPRSWPYRIRPLRFMPAPAESVPFEQHYGFFAVEELQEQLLAALQAEVGRAHRGWED